MTRRDVPSIMVTTKLVTEETFPSLRCVASLNRRGLRIVSSPTLCPACMRPLRAASFCQEFWTALIEFCARNTSLLVAANSVAALVSHFHWV